MRRRWKLKGRRELLTPELLHFLVSGCFHWGARADFDLYLFAGSIARGKLDRLRELLAAHGEAVKAQAGDAAVYAEVMLAGGRWPWMGEPWYCVEHRHPQGGVAWPRR